MKHLAKCRDMVITTSGKSGALATMVTNTPDRLKNENILSKKCCRRTENNKSEDTRVLYYIQNTQKNNPGTPAMNSIS